MGVAAVNLPSRSPEPGDHESGANALEGCGRSRAAVCRAYRPRMDRPRRWRWATQLPALGVLSSFVVVSGGAAEANAAFWLWPEE